MWRCLFRLWFVARFTNFFTSLPRTFLHYQTFSKKLLYICVFIIFISYFTFAYLIYIEFISCFNFTFTFHYGIHCTSTLFVSFSRTNALTLRSTVRNIQTVNANTAYHSDYCKLYRHNCLLRRLKLSATYLVSCSYCWKYWLLQSIVWKRFACVNLNVYVRFRSILISSTILFRNFILHVIILAKYLICHPISFPLKSFLFKSHDS